MNPYEVLGLERTCSNKDIKNALHKLAKIHHPDIGGDSDKFTEINRAAQILRNSHTRRLFDMYGTVIEESEEIMHQMIIEKFTEYANVWINNQLETESEIPIKEFLKNHVDNLRGGLDDHIVAMEKHIKFLEKRRKEISVTEGEENIIHKVMDEKIRTFRSASTKMKRDKVLMGMLYDYIDIYSSTEVRRIDSDSDPYYRIMQQGFGGRWF